MIWFFGCASAAQQNWNGNWLWVLEQKENKIQNEKKDSNSRKESRRCYNNKCILIQFDNETHRRALNMTWLWRQSLQFSFVLWSISINLIHIHPFDIESSSSLQQAKRNGWRTFSHSFCSFASIIPLLPSKWNSLSITFNTHSSQSKQLVLPRLAHKAVPPIRCYLSFVDVVDRFSSYAHLCTGIYRRKWSQEIHGYCQLKIIHFPPAHWTSVRCAIFGPPFNPLSPSQMQRKPARKTSEDEWISKQMQLF